MDYVTINTHTQTYLSARLVFILYSTLLDFGPPFFFGAPGALGACNLLFFVYMGGNHDEA